MSIHKLAEVTIEVYGLPEYCGTDDQLQELTDEAEALVEVNNFKGLLNQMLFEEFPFLFGRITFDVKGS